VEEYEVEWIEGERKTRGKREFLVKWKGYGDAERTWELLEHLDNARNVLDDQTARSSDKAPADRTDMDKLNKSNRDDKPESDGKSSTPLRRSSRHKISSPE